MPNVIANPYALVLLATVGHAYWNYLLKRAGGGQLFVGLSKIAEALMFAPVFIVVGWPEARMHASQLVPLATVGATLTLVNYAMLAVAYQRADLSYVYPISRGSILLFVPVLGFAVFGEHLDVRGSIAIGLILCGIVVLSLQRLDWSELRSVARRMISNAGAGYAMLAAAAAAGYTVWDKRAIHLIRPFTYFYAYTVIVACVYAAYLLRRYGLAAISDEMRLRGGAIAQVGFFNTVTYLLVLLALRDGVTSYIVAVRQLSIAFGALLGWRLLHEEFGSSRRLGVALIVTGTLLAAFGPH